MSTLAMLVKTAARWFSEKAVGAIIVKTKGEVRKTRDAV